MTVTYSKEVATTSKGFGSFAKLLFRWRGSVFKVVWHELLLYILLYMTVSLIYRLALSEDQRRFFEKLVLYVETSVNFIPVSFVLGFYVNFIMGRWTSGFLTIPWPDSTALHLTTGMPGNDEESRLIRRSVMRYLHLSLVLVMRSVSTAVYKRFPTIGHLVVAGLLTDEEEERLAELGTQHPVYWQSMMWAGHALQDARRKGLIADDITLKTIMENLGAFRSSCGGLLCCDTLTVPLVYTQVVTLSVYTYFVSTLIGRQFLDPSQQIPGHEVDLYVPVFTLLQFLFYVGWLKVAETLINPFGEDDDDFNLNSILDRNFKVGYLQVDPPIASPPALRKDIFFNTKVLKGMPYTVALKNKINTRVEGTALTTNVPERLQMVMRDTLEFEADGTDEADFAMTIENNSNANVSVQIQNSSSKYADNEADSVQTIRRRRKTRQTRVS